MISAALALLACAVLVSAGSGRRLAMVPTTPITPRGVGSGRWSRAAKPNASAREAADEEALPDRSRRASWVLAATVGLLIVLTMRSVLGVVVAALSAVLVHRVLRRAAGRAATSEPRLAPVLDLAVLLLRTGAPPTHAFAEATALGDGRLQRFGKQLRAREAMGQPPVQQWAELTADPRLRPVADAALRSADSGAALADAWSALAAAERSHSAMRAEATARRAGVHALGPLGLCFLPAFICLAVVPMVIGLLGDLVG